MTLKTKMEKVIANTYKNIGGIIVLKNGITQYENYFNGCKRNSTLHVFSVTKSIISILIGIAIDKGFIKSIDQKILDFFPDYKVRQGENTIQNITLKEILTMTAPYKYKAEPYKEYFASENWVEASLNFLGGKGQVGDFRYAPIIGPDILSGILVNATGQSVLDFATEYLFSPLEIKVESNIIFKNKEEQLAFYKAMDVKGWVADPNGTNTAGWGLNLTSMDMAKLGQLYLNKGVWDGREIVSAEWIEASTKVHSRCNQWKLSYGYLWWIIDNKEHIYAAMGDGGNVIYINAKKGIVIAIASLFVPNAKDRIELIQKYVEPAFEDYV